MNRQALKVFCLVCSIAGLLVAFPACTKDEGGQEEDLRACFKSSPTGGGWVIRIERPLSNDYSVHTVSPGRTLEVRYRPGETVYYCSCFISADREFIDNAANCAPYGTGDMNRPCTEDARREVRPVNCD